MFKNKEAIVNLDAFIPVFELLYEMNPEPANSLEQELRYKLDESRNTLLDESASLNNYYRALEAQREIIQAFSSYYLNYTDLMTQRILELQESGPHLAERFFDKSKSLLSEYFESKKKIMHLEVENDRSWYAGIKDGASKSGFLVNSALSGLNKASKSITGNTLVENSHVIDSRTLVEKLFEKHLDLSTVGIDITNIFEKAVEDYKKDWVEKIDQQTPDIKLLNAYSLANEAGSVIKFNMPLGMAEQTLAVGLGSAVVGTVGLAAGWHTITYALLNVFPPIAAVALIATAVAGVATQDAVVKQRKNQINEQVDKYYGYFLTLLDREPIPQMGGKTLRKYINYSNEQIIEQTLKKWEQAFPFSVEACRKLNQACANQLVYIQEALEDVYYQKTKNSVEDVHRQNRVSFANERKLSDSEIRDILGEAFLKAKKEIDIVSPWIRSWIFDRPFSDWFEATLKKGVIIKILYGLEGDNSVDKKSYDDTEKNAQELQKKFNKYCLNGQLKMKHGNTHAKLLICDDLFYVIGSFNWLSFRGDYSNGKTRGESAEYSENKVQLAKWRKDSFDF